MNLNIFKAEGFFNIEIKEDWAKYSWNANGKEYTGNLFIRGTTDLLVKLDEDTLHYIDYKTGRVRWCWTKNRLKDKEDFENDSQLLLYLYAVRNLYPQYKYLMVDVFYTRDKPVSVFFDDNAYERAKQLIKDKFLKIKKVKKPEWVINNPAKNHFCTFCQFNKVTLPGHDKVICKSLRGELEQIGMNKLTDKYIKIDSHQKYEGGGKAIQL